MHAAMSHDPSIPRDQQHLIYALWSHIVEGPGLFRLVTDLVLSKTPPCSDVVETTIQRIQSDVDHLRKWLDMARTLGLATEASRLERDVSLGIWSGESSSRPRVRLSSPVLQGTYVTCFIIKTRLLSSLSPMRFSGLEAECQELAGEVVRMHSNTARQEDEGVFGGLYMSQTYWMAKGTADTKDIWMTDLVDNLPDGKGDGMVEKWKFEEWCRAVGRKFT